MALSFALVTTHSLLEPFTHGLSKFSRQRLAKPPCQMRRSRGELPLGILDQPIPGNANAQAQYGRIEIASERRVSPVQQHLEKCPLLFSSAGQASTRAGGRTSRASAHRSEPAYRPLRDRDQGKAIRRRNSRLTVRFVEEADDAPLFWWETAWPLAM